MHYTPNTPTADRSVTMDHAPLLRAWRSTSPASIHLVEQLALLWLDDDRRELRQLVPAATPWTADDIEDEFED